MDDKLPTDLLVSAQMRVAADKGIPIVLRHRGDPTSGVIVLKINRLDGTSRVLAQIRLDDELAWSPASKNDPMPESDAEKYIAQQIDVDPDIWVLEIEDREARHWFPGRVVNI